MGNNSDPVTLHKYLYANANPVNMIDPSGQFSLIEFGVADSIRSTLSELTIDVGFSLLDSQLGGGENSAQDNTGTYTAIAALGASGVALTAILAKKFTSLSKAKKFDKFRSGLFGNLKSVRPRSRDKITIPSGGVVTLSQGGVSSLKRNEVYIYVVDASDNLKLAVRGSAGKSGVKHTQLTGGGAAKAAGELLIVDGKILLNNQSGRYSSQSPNAISSVKALFQSEGVAVTITGPL